MNIITKFTDWLIRTPLLEQAYYRRDGIDKIRSLSGTIIKHLIKIQLIDSRDKPHWKSEVLNYFNKIDEIRIKPKNSKLSEKEYYELLFLEPYCLSNNEINQKYIEKLLLQINLQYGVELKYTQIDWNKLKTFFETISNNIAKDEDIQHIILEL